MMHMKIQKKKKRKDNIDWVDIFNHNHQVNPTTCHSPPSSSITIFFTYPLLFLLILDYSFQMVRYL